MKQVLLLCSLLLFAAPFLFAQSPPYHVVFDLTSKDSTDQKAVMRWIDEIMTDHPDARLEVVMYGKGYELVMPEKSSPVAAMVKETIQSKPNVSFKVCQMAMKNNKIQKSQLYNGVQTVPDGIYEIISKQAENWGYIKVSH